MATNIPPHNLREVISGAIALLDDPDCEIDALMEHISGRIFQLPGLSMVKRESYRPIGLAGAAFTCVPRPRFLRMRKSGKQTIVVTEIPYQLNKSKLIERIAELVKEKKLEGITELRDESDKDGLRIVIELRRGEIGDVVLNNLYAQTQMQSVFGINMVALVDGQPRLLNLKEVLESFSQASARGGLSQNDLPVA